jgi:hypothetical protein
MMFACQYYGANASHVLVSRGWDYRKKNTSRREIGLKPYYILKECSVLKSSIILDRQLNTTKPYKQKILDRINHWFALPQARELKHELSVVREGNQALRLDIQAVHSRLENIRNREEAHLAKVRSRMEHIESDRDVMHQQLEQIHTSLSDASHRQDTLDGRLAVLIGKLEEHHMDHQVENQDARLRDRKQVRRLNIAMTLAGCAFLVTTVGCVARMEDIRKNTSAQSDIRANSSDTQHTHQVSGIWPEPLEAVSTVMPDKAPPAEGAVRLLANVRTGQEVFRVPQAKAGLSKEAGLPHESQYRPSSHNERLTAVGAVVPVRSKTAPATITFREGVPDADEIPEPEAQAAPNDVLADLFRLGGPLPVKNGSENTVSEGPSLVVSGARRDTAFSELTHGQNDKSTFFKSNYNVGKLFSLGAAFTEKNRDDEFDSLTNQKKGFWHVKMNSSLLGPSLDAEMALSSFDTETSEDFWTSDRRMLRLGSETNWQGFNIGARYQSVGKDFENTAGLLKSGHKKKKDKLEQDTQGPELWSSRQFGNLGVKAYTSLYSTNLAGDRTLPRFTRQKVGSSVNYQISSWPEVGVKLDYATGTLGSSDEPAGFNSVSQGVRDIGSSIYFAGDLWSGSLSVKNAKGKASGANVTDMQMFYAEASYLPIDTVSITPSISYIREYYPEFDLDSDTTSSSLTFGYKPEHGGLNYTLYSEYSTEENTDWDVDNSYLYTSLGVNWDSKKPKSLIKQWSAELFYDQYIDNIYSDSNVGGLGFMLKLRSSPMSARRYMNDLR